MNAHTIRKQTLHVSAASQAIALALQARLGDFNRKRLLPVIERVLDEMDLPGCDVRIGKLEVDLGRISAAGFESEMESRLEEALRRSLEKALRGVEARSREESRRETLEHCLLYGTLPWWAARRSAFSLEALVLEMAEADPEGLVETVRELGRDRRVLERLAAQLGETALRRLVALLEPEHAAVIFAYLVDVREVNRGERLLSLSDRAMTRLLWVLTQAYLVSEPGSQFNRRSFVRSLLRGLAAREGLRYEAVLAALLRGLERTAERLPLGSSLLGVLRELGEDQEDLDDTWIDGPPPKQDGGLVPPQCRDAPWGVSGAETSPPEREGAAGRLPDAGVLPRSVDAPRGVSTMEGSTVGAEMDGAALDALLDSVCPEEADALRELLRIFARIPSPYRPRPESLVRRVILEEAYRFREGEAVGAESFGRVLRALFATPLSEPVYRALRREGGAWREHGEDFLAALAAAGPGRQEGGNSDADLRRSLLEILAGPPEAARELLLRHRGNHERWAKVLPESALVRAAEILEPRKHRVLLQAAEVLASAWGETAPRQHPDLADRSAFWSFLLGFLSDRSGEGLSVERLVTAFFEHTAAASPSASRREETGTRLLETAGRLARAGGHAVLNTALQRRKPVLLKPWEERRNPRKASRSPKGPERSEDADSLYAGNAGLVLAGPFLPHLFKTLDLLQEVDGKLRLRGDEAVSRAVHLLQSLVDGRVDAPEPELALNKLLCGVPLSTPVDREIVPTERELEVCGQLLRSMLANWGILTGTSVAGLQETFLRREGRLQRGDDGWKLRVQRKTVDVLVDQVPWSVSVIYHRWMPQPVQVTW